MKLLYSGKTKDVFENDDKNIVLKFKDDVTGKDGKFDPGENQVGLSIEGVGNKNLTMSKYFFEKLKEQNISSHYISADLKKNTMTVKKASVFGKGVEVIIRYRAVGSFMKRYALYATEGQELDNYVEFTIKDDGRQDPLITRDALDMLGIIKKDEYDKIKELNIKIAGIIRDELAKKGLELYDLKLEFGKLEETGEICLIDEISGGNMRVFDKGQYVEPMELGGYFA